MVWITVKIQPTDPEDPAEFAVSAVKDDSEEWVDVPHLQAALRAIVTKKNPRKSPEELIAEGEIRMNVAAADAMAFFESGSGGQVSSKSLEKGDQPSDNEVAPLVADLLSKFSSLLAAELKQSHAPVKRPSPTVF